jgi:hypothetical protein
LILSRRLIPKTSAHSRGLSPEIIEGGSRALVAAQHRAADAGTALLSENSLLGQQGGSESGQPCRFTSRKPGSLVAIAASLHEGAESGVQGYRGFGRLVVLIVLAQGSIERSSD